MAFILMPNLSPPPTTLLHSKDKHIHHHNHLTCSSSSSSSFLFPSNPALLTLTKLEPPPVRVAQLNQPPLALEDNSNNSNKDQRDDFYVNLGLAVRTLREDLPLLFTRDLNYDIYRDDITFLDPLNKFTGIDNYKLIFWALRFHGRILFRHISLEVVRVWQPSENVILIRWNLSGVPRVPWEAKGQFQGTSRYKLDRRGKIYEHKVDNLAFNFPQQLKPPAVSVLDLVTACPPSPNPTFSPFFLSYSSPTSSSSSSSSSWLELYRAVRVTLDHPHPQASLIPLDCLPICS